MPADPLGPADGAEGPADGAEGPAQAAEGAPTGPPGAAADDAARAALERARAAATGSGRPPRRRGRHVPPTSTPGAGGAGSRGEPFGQGRDPVPVGSTLGRLLADRGWRGPLSVASVVGRWREVVGEPLADHCRPETFEDGALVVRADSTAWAMQVRLLLPQLQRRLEEEVGAGVVASITVLGPAGPSWRRGPRSVPGRGPRDTYG